MPEDTHKTERALLHAIEARSRGIRLDGAELIAGPGDDCAVVQIGNESLLITVDQLVEGRHAEPGTPIDPIARKAVARSISDIAAMGGEPIWATATGLLPEGYPHADALFDAMKRWAEHWNTPLIGGDIAAGPGPLALTVTVVGRMPSNAPPVLRSGATPGQSIYTSGPIGGSLASGRHLTFEPRLDAGRAARELGATAMIDLSDGLGIDADRLARASGVRLLIEAESVPMHPDAGPWRHAFADGEDYELLVCAPERPSGFSGPIGRVESGPPGAVILDEHGNEHAAERLGWDHADRSR